MITDSDSRLDHSMVFDRDTAPHLQISGGGIPSQPSPQQSADNENAEDPDEENENTPVEEEDEETEAEPVITFSNPQFINADSATIDSDISVQVNCEFSDSNVYPVQFTMASKYKEAIEKGPQVDGTISEDGIATATINLAQNMEFYHDESKTQDDKIEFSFDVICTKDNTALSSAPLLLPRKYLNIDVIEVVGSLFNTNSAVPCIDSEGLLIDSLKKTLSHAQEWPDKKIIIFGHTDTTSTHSVNFPLSEKRAQALKALLTNDAEGWNSAIEGNTLILDFQRIINGLGANHGWGCDCGNEDNENGPKTKDGLKAFQGEYNSKFEKSLTVDGIIGPQSWGAIMHSLYDLATQHLDSEPATLTFGHEDFGYYACGESFPIEEALLDRFESETNRRCEIGFHETPNPPELVTHTVPADPVTFEECPVYDTIICERTIIPLESSTPPIMAFVFSY